MNLTVYQTQIMWVNQLQHDPDIIGKIIAVNNLKKYPAKETLTVLITAVTNPVRASFLPSQLPMLKSGFHSQARKQHVSVSC